VITIQDPDYPEATESSLMD